MPCIRNIIYKMNQIYLKRLQDATLADDYMFGQVMSREAIAAAFLTALLQKPIRKISRISRQSDFTDSFFAHGVRLDVYLNDENGTHYDIEMQTTNQKDIEKRIRYYQSTIDREVLGKGIPYSDISESYIIFLCSFDYYGQGEPVYERQSFIKGYPEILYLDGTHALILNAKYRPDRRDRNNQPLMEFLNYLQDEHSPFESQLVQAVSAAVQEVRNDEKKGVEYMTIQQKLLDEKNLSFQEGEAAGLQKEGLQKGEARFSALIQKMLKDNLSSEIPRLTEDSEFRNAMYQKYNL